MLCRPEGRNRYLPSTSASQNSSGPDTALWSVPSITRSVATPGRNASKSVGVSPVGTSYAGAAAQRRCLESETVDLLREVHEHAVEGDIAWLKTKGKVYQLVDAA